MTTKDKQIIDREIEREMSQSQSLKNRERERTDRKVERDHLIKRR